MSRQTRRSFLQHVTAASGAAGLFAISGTKSSGQVVGSNEAIRVGVVGLNGRGGSHVSEFNKPDAGSRVAALCDVDYRVLEGRAKRLQNVQTFQDVRQMLESKDIDAVSIATCNHWHSLITIWACQAGKDVYVEKPCSHNVFEGRKCVEAARKYKRIVQHGTQSRASSEWNKIAAVVKSGKYGRLLVSKGYCCKSRWTIGHKAITNPPPHLDFNLWLGPAPEQPYHPNLVHYNWHWFWDTGNGDMGNQGVHQIDIARWMTGKTLPRSVVSLGGRWVNEPGFKDQGETPNQIVSVFDYGDSLVLFETRGLVGNQLKGFPGKVDNELYFEGGVIRDGKFFPKGSDQGEDLPDVEFKRYPEGNFGNFLKACRTRNHEDLCGDIEEAHLSAALCHLGNIPYRMGTLKKFEMPQGFTDNEIVSDSVKTLLENTAAIGVNVENTMMMVGPKLEFNPETEKFVDNPAADQFLTRPYRKPFVVPEQV